MQAHAHDPHSEMEASILKAIVLDVVRGRLASGGADAKRATLVAMKCS